MTNNNPTNIPSPFKLKKGQAIIWDNQWYEVRRPNDKGLIDLVDVEGDVYTFETDDVRRFRLA